MNTVQQCNERERISNNNNQQNRDQNHNESNYNYPYEDENQCNNSDNLNSNSINRDFAKNDDYIDFGEYAHLVEQEYKCPITQELMIDPYIVTVCGHSFEKQEIFSWLSKKRSCPLCNKKATTNDL